jgi:beta-glucosidase
MISERQAHPRAPLAAILAVLTFLAAAGGATAEPALYLDPNRPLEQRVEDLLSRLTLEEKAILLNHRGPDIERLGIKSDKWNQCLHGVWWTEPTTMFPVSIAQAATWDPALIHEVATVISNEARAIYNGWPL